MSTITYNRRIVSAALAVVCLLFLAVLSVNAQSGRTLYNEIKAFSLTGGKAELNSFVFQRDRVEMNLTGTIYFAAPVNGRITGAVFSGRGNFRSAVPEDEFERANVKRLLGVENVIETDFKTAVFRFTDDSGEVLGAAKTQSAAPPDVQTMATEVQERMLKETGANIASRIALSLVNHQDPGFFFAHFDGGRRGRFSYILDEQNRIPTDYFDINAGEKGLIFKYSSDINGNDIWMAFHTLADRQRGTVPYSSENDLADVDHYDMNIDLTRPGKHLLLNTQMKMHTRFSGIGALPFLIGESLGEYDSLRLKKQMRVKSARMGGADLEFVQEDWEGGFTIFFNKDLAKGEQLAVDVELEGDFLTQPDNAPLSACSYPLSNTTWYPRHGYLDRSTYDMTFKHDKRKKVATVGTRKSEGPSDGDKNVFLTKYEIKQPVALVTFALGPFRRYQESIKWDDGATPTPLEFNSIDGVIIKEDLIMAELNNSVRYFHKLFGNYPYETYSGTFHPYGFGQGFPSMLMIPPTNQADKRTFSFVAHETAHQWWGNIVSWRSYRDQWLSEGFAEYSGIAYTTIRKDHSASKKLVEEMRDSLRQPPSTLSGGGKGKLFEIGPITLGHRLSSRKTLEGYQTLIYNKGALVLRMIHFLMTDPESGDGQPFFDMMKDFVERHRNQTASTDDFRQVVNEHFARTKMAKRYGVNNLNWFFRQWVYQSAMPSYQLEYSIEDQSDGSVMLTGNVLQENVPEDWFMALPIAIHFGSDKFAQTSVAAKGARTPFRIKLPMKPQKVELDPQRWVLSEKTTTK